LIGNQMNQIQSNTNYLIGLIGEIGKL